MSKQTFTTGQILTAAQMTTLQANDYNQTVNAKVASYTLVASDAGTRITMNNASATAITVNTALFTAGDILTITNIGTGACTITAGTATVSSSGSTILAQYDSGTLYFSSTSAAIWNGANPGDITGVTAGTGISGGGTSGTVTVTNSMATEITAAGDIIVGTGSGTFDNLPIGTTAQVLTADTTVSPYKVKWATPSGGMTLLSTTALTGASTTITGISTSYTNLYVFVSNMLNNTANGIFKIELISSTNGIYANSIQNGTVSDLDGTFLSSGANLDRSTSNNAYSLYIDDYASSFNFKPINFYGVGYGSSYLGTTISGGFYGGGSAITSLKFSNTGGTFSQGTVLVYGVK